MKKKKKEKKELTKINGKSLIIAEAAVEEMQHVDTPLNAIYKFICVIKPAELAASQEGRKQAICYNVLLFLDGWVY